MAVIPSPFVPAGAPVGPAGGDLKGSYPSPQVASVTHMSGAATSTSMVDTFVTGDANARYNVNADGGMSWGGGTLATDTNLYRAAAGLLQTDSSLQVNGQTTAVAGLILPRRTAPTATANAITLFSLDGASLSGVESNGDIVNFGGTVSSITAPVTVANNATELIINQFVIPANSVTGTSAFQGRVFANVSTAAAGAVDITVRLRVGGLAGPVIASTLVNGSNSITDQALQVDFTCGVITAGIGGTWTGSILVVDEISGGPNAHQNSTTGTVQDTTIPVNLVLTFQWALADPANTYTVVQTYIRQIK